MSTLVQTPITIPYLQQIKDPAIYQALRFLGDQVGRLTRGAFQGTLSPDQRPQRLTAQDAGQEFFATDFARGYRWTGTAWQDLPDAPGRFQCVLFAQAPEPPIGWSPCNGQNTVRSTSSGGVATFTTPNIPFNAGLQYWVRL
jgi:hypothetical protein